MDSHLQFEKREMYLVFNNRKEQRGEREIDGSVVRRGRGSRRMQINGGGGGRRIVLDG